MPAKNHCFLLGPLVLATTLALSAPSYALRCNLNIASLAESDFQLKSALKAFGLEVVGSRLSSKEAVSVRIPVLDLASEGGSSGAIQYHLNSHEKRHGDYVLELADPAEAHGLVILIRNLRTDEIVFAGVSIGHEETDTHTLDYVRQLLFTEP